MMETEVSVNEFVTFQIEGEIFAINMAPMQEIIRVPQMVKVPKSPPSLIGLANLRGKVLPIINLRTVFEINEKEIDDSSRVIVVDFGETLGFLVDRVASVIEVDKSKIEETSDVQSIVKSEFLKGVIKDIAGFNMVMILNIDKIFEREFSELYSKKITEAHFKGRKIEEEKEEVFIEERQLISFLVANEEYAIPIENIQEIVQIPEHISKVPNSEKSIIGMMNLRDKILPLVSLRALFSLPEKELDEECRIVVLSLGKLSVGLVVDSVREVLRVSKSLIEPIPSILLKDEGSSEIEEICRLDRGKRLVSIISVSNLLKGKKIKEVLSSVEEEKTEMEQKKEVREQVDDEEQFVVFKIDEQEYAVPITSVQEIVRVPEDLTRVPKTPDFVEGVINLRGTILPVINLRKRFDLTEKPRDELQRIMVLIIDNLSVGFIVDTVSEVLNIPKSYIQKAIELSHEQAQLFSRVANLEKQGRVIQIIETKNLLKKEEIEKLEKSEEELEVEH
ncbi:chemotaxis protein CheW [Caldimicrobium thiodismutans]|uniref:Chemotaxis protein CheW n=1 Tax=Caldimicrobium thiodismutans TaxID=1653476 RepID=A0A0U5APP4_9BACT|nr:chemotaxis protein CheW [Caldimicrobium thiodismutans]BAU22817.1 chemotaxis protein CheW [Caldimicrobium thiodismutans]